jgi:hypothetical protein
MEAPSITKECPLSAEGNQVHVVEHPACERDRHEPAPTSEASASMPPVLLVVKEAVLRRLMRWQA